MLSIQADKRFRFLGSDSINMEPYPRELHYATETATDGENELLSIK